MGLFGTFLRKLSGPPTCGDKETLVQPGDYMDFKCTLPSGHSGNHYDSRYSLQWGRHPHHELFKDRPAP